MALITVSYRGGSTLSGAQLVVLEAVAPIERGLNRAWAPVAGAWDWTGRLFTATSQNPQLERENAELREQVRIAKEQEAELYRVRRMLNFNDTFNFPRGYEFVAASVTVRTPGAVERSLVIDRGTSDGIAVDDPVMVTGGLIGRVTDVTSNNAVVGLLLNDGQRVSASVTGSEAWGVLRTISTEGTPVLQLRFVKQSAKVEKNDQVVTSGFASANGELRSVYPKGLPIGIVDNVGNDPADVDKTVQITPFADFDRIDEVLVLVPTSGRGA